MNQFHVEVHLIMMDLLFSLSAEDRKLVVMDNFSDVVYLVRIPAFLADHGSNVSSNPSSDLNEKNNSLIFLLISYKMTWAPCIKCQKDYINFIKNKLLFWCHAEPGLFLVRLS